MALDILNEGMCREVFDGNLQNASEGCIDRITLHVYMLYLIFELKYDTCIVVRRLNRILRCEP